MNASYDVQMLNIEISKSAGKETHNSTNISRKKMLCTASSLLMFAFFFYLVFSNNGCYPLSTNKATFCFTFYRFFFLTLQPSFLSIIPACIPFFYQGSQQLKLVFTNQDTDAVRIRQASINYLRNEHISLGSFSDQDLLALVL